MSLSDAEAKIIEKAVRESLEEIEKYAPEEYAKLNADPQKKKAVTEAAREAAAEEVNLAKEFAGQPDDIAERLAKHLPESRIMMIRKGLEFPTFRMDIIKKDDGKHWVELKRGQEALEPARALQSSDDIDWAKIKQYASIVVEAISLGISAVGISLSINTATKNKAIDATIEGIRSSSVFQRALDAFVEAWKMASGAYEKAKALFFLIKDTNAGSILWTIIKALCREMAWYDWLLIVVKVIAMIIAAVVTGGAVLIAKVALIVLDAIEFARKIANLVQLEAIKIAM